MTDAEQLLEEFLDSTNSDTIDISRDREATRTVVWLPDGSAVVFETYNPTQTRQLLIDTLGSTSTD